MDLRQYDLSDADVDRAAEVLNYQPFVVSSDFQTGVAYSWIGGDDPRVAPPLIFHRKEWEAQWEKITESNQRLSNLYDDLIDEVARRFPGGSFLDVACNNGYFPVAASLRGMEASGFDMGLQYKDSVDFLNKVTGSSAKFMLKQYDPGSRPEIEQLYDVVSASAIMCHLPDPLHFLAYLGAHAKKAVLFWGQVIDTEALCAAWSPPHVNLSDPRVFPYTFNDNTRVSLGLFKESMRLMGFKDVIEIGPYDNWLWGGVQPKFELETEIKNGSRHQALLALR